MRFAASRAFELFAILWSLSFGARLVYHMLNFREDEVRRTSRFWARGMLWGLRRLAGLHHTVEGWEDTALEPRLIFANHQSWWETVAFFAIEPELTVVAKKSLARIPLFGWFLRRSGQILIDRDMSISSVRQIIARARDAIAAGRSVLIFPEGARRAVDAEIEVKRSLFLIYQQVGAPAAPATHNAGMFVPKGAGVIYPGCVTVSYHPLLEPGLDRDSFLRQARAALQLGKDRLAEMAGRT